jgi:hypothetical protein
MLIHPDYYIETESARGQIFLTQSTTIEAVDNSQPTEEKIFKCNRHDCVKVNYPGGEKKWHYCNDKTVVRVVEGREEVYYANKEIAELEGYKFSARLKAFAKKDNPNFYGSERILGYHSTDARAVMATKEDRYKVGIEVEKEDSRYQQDGLVWELFEKTGWAREQDGSLGSGGYELISPVMPLDNLDRIKEICHPVKKMLNGNVSPACGGHFNISCEDMTSKELMDQMKPFAGVLYSLYKGRMNNRYCSAKQWDDYYAARDKYVAFLVKNDKVVEIRLFSAVKTMTSLLWRVRLMQILLRRKNWNVSNYLQSMADTKSRLHGHLRKLFTYEQVIEKCKDAFKFQTDYCGLGRNRAEYAKCKAFIETLSEVTASDNMDE